MCQISNYSVNDNSIINLYKNLQPFYVDKFQAIFLCQISSHQYFLPEYISHCVLLYIKLLFYVRYHNHCSMADITYHCSMYDITYHCSMYDITTIILCTISQPMFYGRYNIPLTNYFTTIVFWLTSQTIVLCMLSQIIVLCMVSQPFFCV